VLDRFLSLFLGGLSEMDENLQVEVAVMSAHALIGALAYGESDKVNRHLNEGRLIEKIIVVFAPTEPASEPPSPGQVPELKVHFYDAHPRD